MYFRALAPSQYLVIAPMFVTADDPAAKVVVLEPGLPVQDMQPGGLVSAPDVRAYATRDARIAVPRRPVNSETVLPSRYAAPNAACEGRAYAAAGAERPGKVATPGLS